MIEHGKIIKILPDNQVEVAMLGNSCQKCQGCLIAAGSCGQNKVIVKNTAEHKIGDEVEIEIPTKIFYKAFFLVFILPIIVLITAILVLQFLQVEQETNLLISFGLFLAAFYFANRYDKNLKEQQIYKIIR